MCDLRLLGLKVYIQDILLKFDNFIIGLQDLILHYILHGIWWQFMIFALCYFGDFIQSWLELTLSKHFYK